MKGLNTRGTITGQSNKFLTNFSKGNRFTINSLTNPRGNAGSMPQIEDSGRVLEDDSNPRRESRSNRIMN